ncbi:hypothetical protein As57867_016076, partial [Aphanomyces stellatus]
TLIASDSGFVSAPEAVDATGLVLFPLERVELVCDFSSIAAGTVYTLKDAPSADSSYAYDPRVIQLRVVAPKTAPAKVDIPKKMSAFKDLQALYKSTNGKLRTITLGEMEGDNKCPSQLMVVQRQMVANVSTIQNKLMCTLGKVEKWQFKNPTDDAHPFHWHLVNAQCGPDDNSINKNQLKDVVVIPNEPQSTKVTQAAYAVGGNGIDLEAIEESLAVAAGDAPGCDKTCHGKAYFTVVGCFFWGVLIIVLMEILVHKVIDFHAKRLGQQVAARQQAPSEPEAGELIPKTPQDDAPNDYNQRTELGRAGVMTGIAIAIHNFPEGLALFVASLQGLRSGIILAIGIILHNFPKGVAIAAPVYFSTKSYKQVLFWTGLSGIAQPCGALIGWATIANGMNNVTVGKFYGLVSACCCASPSRN